MEFIKKNFFDGPVMGKYRYMFSYDYDSDTVFNTPSSYDPMSNRWFSEFGYTYCTSRGISLAIDGDDMDMYWFWQKHPKDHVRESYYHWTYQDDAMTVVNITYTLTEYSDAYYRTCHFSIENVTEEQFQDIKQKIMDWHTAGKLMIGNVELEMGPWRQNLCCIPQEPDLNPTIGSLIEAKEPVEVQKIIDELKRLTNVQDKFINRISAIIHANYNELLSVDLETNEIATVLYKKVISDPEIAPHSWMYETLEQRLTDPVPFA